MSGYSPSVSLLRLDPGARILERPRATDTRAAACAVTARPAVHRPRLLGYRSASRPVQLAFAAQKIAQHTASLAAPDVTSQNHDRELGSPGTEGAACFHPADGCPATTRGAAPPRRMRVGRPSRAPTALAVADRMGGTGTSRHRYGSAWGATRCSRQSPDRCEACHYNTDQSFHQNTALSSTRVTIRYPATRLANSWPGEA